MYEGADAEGEGKLSQNSREGLLSEEGSDTYLDTIGRKTIGVDLSPLQIWRHHV